MKNPFQSPLTDTDCAAGPGAVRQILGLLICLAAGLLEWRIFRECLSRDYLVEDTRNRFMIWSVLNGLILLAGIWSALGRNAAAWSAIPIMAIASYVLWTVLQMPGR